MKTSEIRSILNVILSKSLIKYWDVLPIDRFEVRNKYKFPAAFVINTQKHYVRTCGHWVCVVLLDRRHVMYFDSLGKAVPPEIKSLCPIVLNKRQLQSRKSLVCAEYCIFVLYQASCGVDSKRLLRIFTRNRLRNDKIVSSFVNKIKKKCL
jgi:hypothetical protein